MLLEVFLQMLANGVMLSFMYILMATGLTLLFGMMDVINFAHGVVYMLGAYAVFYLYAELGLSYYLSLLLAILGIGLFGIIVEKALFRPIRGKILETLILAAGIAFLIQSLANIGFGTQPKSVPTVIAGGVNFLGASFPLERLVPILGGAVVFAGLYFLLYYTNIGRGMRAYQQDKVAATLQGVSLDRVCSAAFFIASGLAAAAGALIAPIFIIEPGMGSLVLLKSFIVVIVGGLGSIPGAVAAGFLFGMIDSFGGTLLGPEIAYGFGFAMLVAVIVLRPRGLLGLGTIS